MKKIMLVDDSTSIRTILKSVLITEYEVMDAVDGLDALKKIENFTPDLFLLDVNMPNMDGLTLLKELRQKAIFKTTPIIMLTTETKNELREDGKASGATGWITKPCDPETLLFAIKRIL